MSIEFILILFGTFAYITIGVACLFYNQGARLNKLFAASLFLIAVYLVSLYYSIPFSGVTSEASLTLSARIAYGTSTLFFYLMAIFFSRYIIAFDELPFMQTKPMQVIFKIGRYLFLVEAILLTVVSLATPLIYEGMTVHADKIGFDDHFGRLFHWTNIHYVLCLFVSFLFPLIKLFYTKRMARKKLASIFIVYAIATFVTLLFNQYLPTVYGIFDYYLYGGMCYIPFAVITFFFMAKYRFLGTQFIYWRVAKVALSITITLVVCYFTLMYISIIVMNPGLQYGINTVLAVAVFYVMHDVLLKKFFYGKQHERLKASLEELTEELKFTTSFSDFAEQLRITFTQKLGISSAEIFTTDPNTVHRFLPTYPENELTAILKKDHRPVVTEEIEFSELPLGEEYYKALVHLSVLHASVCIPLFFRSDLVGFLLLGKKFSHDMYFQEELEGLANLSDYIAIFLVNDALRHEGEKQTAQLKRTEEIVKTNALVVERMQDMQNSLQSAMDVINDIKTKEKSSKLVKIEKNLWELEDKLSIKDEVLYKTSFAAAGFFKKEYTSYYNTMKDKELDYTYEPVNLDGAMIYADQAKLHSICENLLNNAYKFTPHEGKIVMRVTKREKQFIIDMINTGDGILETHKEHIFEEGFSPDGGTGRGVGLTKVKNYVDMHNGEIKEIGIPGVETHFRIVLPIEDAIV